MTSFTQCTDPPVAPVVGWVEAANIDPGYSPAQVACINDGMAVWNCVLANMPAMPVLIGTPATGQTINGVSVEFELANIDGPSGTLALGGPTTLRSGTLIPAQGRVTFDNGDLGIPNAAFCDAVIHEIGHVLGIGTLWQSFSLITGAGTPTPTYNGISAMGWWQANGTGGGAEVPLAPDDAHWSETVFGIENMTPQIDQPNSPLSGLSIASLVDLGYTVDISCAEAYTAPSVLRERAENDAHVRCANCSQNLPKMTIAGDG